MENNNKDKRISFLSILSSLTQFTTLADEKGKALSIAQIKELAFSVNEDLYAKYPIEDENPIKIEPTDEVCPKCKSPKVIKSGTNPKTGKWRGLFCTNPECDENPKWLKVVDIDGVEEKNYPKR